MSFKTNIFPLKLFYTVYNIILYGLKITVDYSNQNYYKNELSRMFEGVLYRQLILHFDIFEIYNTHF